MKNFVRIAVIVVVLALVGAGGYWLYQDMGGGQVASAQSDDFTQTVAVQQGNLSATISVVGELYAPQNETLTFERIDDTTELLTLEVEAGNVVETGQLLASIDPSTYEQALDQALSDLQEAEERLTELQTPATELEIATADLAIARAELKLQQAQETLDDLLSPDIVDLQADVAEARLELAVAQEDLLELKIDDSTADRIYDLQEIEGELSAEYTRIANENYSDTFYQDRLRVAYEDFLNAQDNRITTELQQQIDLHKAETAETKAEWALADAQTALADAQAGGDELDLAEAQQAVAQAEADLVEAQEERSELEDGADAVDLATAQADVDKKNLAVSEAEADLAGTQLTAPFAGTILSTNVEPGENVGSNTKVLTIANLDELQVVASVDETTIRQVEVGQPVEITFDAYPDQTFVGEVLSVPLQGELQGDVMVYDVPISLQGAEDLALLVGMTANAEIQVGEVENALLVPTMALQNFGGLYQVLVPSTADPEGDPETVPVEIGLSNGVYTEIVRGLNLGDEVMVSLTASEATTDMRAMQQMMGGGSGRPPGRN